MLSLNESAFKYAAEHFLTKFCTALRLPVKSTLLYLEVVITCVFRNGTKHDEWNLEPETEGFPFPLTGT